MLLFQGRKLVASKTKTGSETLTAFGFEEVWLTALGPLKGEWGGALSHSPL